MTVLRKIVVLGGYGGMGSVTVKDLVASCKKCLVVVAGRDKKKAEVFARSFKKTNVKSASVDVAKGDDLVQLLEGASVVVNCTQYYWNLDVMKAALAAGVHYLDLGGLYHMTLKQLRLHAKFKKQRLVALLGCGSTPGITNVMARYGASFFDRTEGIDVSFAGYDFVKSRRHLTLPYSIFTLRDEFTDKPVVLKNGKLQFVKPMSGAARLVFPPPIGAITGYYTLHSELATFPKSFGLKECSFRVTFSDDFVHDIKVLIESGVLSDKPIKIGNVRIIPAEVTAKELNRLVGSRKTKVRDREYLRTVLKGTRNGKSLEVTVDCVAQSKQAWNASAGAVDTGVPPSILAQMILAGSIRAQGVYPPEACVPPESFFAELKKRGMKILVSMRAEV